MKRFINLFRDINNQNNGWLGIRGHYFALDKQKHVVLGVLIYLISLIFTSSETSLLIVFFISLFKEFNDMSGLIKILLTSKKKTMFNMFDIIATMIIPTIIHLFIIY